MRIRITSEEIVGKPATPLIYGNFIESGFGRQVEGMWAEMFFNRSFEVVPPYTASNRDSMGCTPDEDCTKYPFWHSGYEENDWYLVPGNDAATWRATRHVSFHHGHQGHWLKNESRTEWAAFAQDGIYLRRGEQYEFSGWMKTAERMWDLRSGDLTLNAEVRIYPEGDWSKPILSQAIGGIGKAFNRYSCTFAVDSFEGRATFSVWIPPQSGLIVDGFSLMPASNVHGWRSDVVEASKRINAPIIRWPGGCFASFYHWREGIGPRDSRIPTESWYWGGLHDNDVGTAEFVQFCRIVNAEPFLCVSMLTGTSDEAAEWVAYCNAPASHPIGALRGKDGFDEPFAVRYWELDNEAFRKYGHHEYSERCVEFSRGMKAVDPSIKTVMVGYDPYTEVLSEMLEIAGHDIDLVVDRAIDEETLRGDLEIIRVYNASHGTGIRLCNTEWPAPIEDIPPTLDPAEVNSVPTAKCRKMCWYSAMNVAKALLTFQRLGGDFAFSNFNNFANTWGQNVIECAKETVCLSAAGRVMELFSRSPAARPLRLELSNGAADVLAQVAWNEGRRSLCLVVLNYRAESVEVTFDLSALSTRFGSTSTSLLHAPSLTAMNTPTSPEGIVRDDSTQEVDDPSEHTILAPAYSVTHAVLS